jgi:hypothetical protein
VWSKSAARQEIRDSADAAPRHHTLRAARAKLFHDAETLSTAPVGRISRKEVWSCLILQRKAQGHLQAVDRPAILEKLHRVLNKEPFLRFVPGRV